MWCNCAHAKIFISDFLVASWSTFNGVMHCEEMVTPHTLSVVSEWCQQASGLLPEAFSFPEHSAYLWAKRRADERTRTADLLITSLLARVLTRPYVSGICAYLWGFEHFWQGCLSTAY